MTAASPPPSDPELLARDLHDGCERSFAALVDGIRPPKPIYRGLFR